MSVIMLSYKKAFKMRVNYPKPKPYQVLGITASDWNYPGRGRPIPSEEEFTVYLSKQGMESMDYAAWRSKVEEAKRANAPDDAKASSATPPAASAPATTSAPSSKPALPFAGLPHQQGKPDAVVMEVMSVRVRPGINARLDLYRAKVRASKQDIVSDVLDAFLTGQGF